MFPGKFDQRLECLLSFRDTRLDIERFHGDPPDVVNHKNTGQMFSGFYHGRRIPCTRKISARATLSLNAFCVRSSMMKTSALPGRRRPTSSKVRSTTLLTVIAVSRFRWACDHESADV